MFRLKFGMFAKQKEEIKMLKKNIDKQKRKSRPQTFIGVRPARFKKKTTYNRQEQKNNTHSQINEKDQDLQFKASNFN